MPSLTHLPFPFPGKVYRSALPFSRMFDPQEELWDKYLKADIRHVVMLLSKEEAYQHTGRDMINFYLRAGLQVIIAPVEDFSVPPFGAFDNALQQVIQRSQQGEALAIHCHAGIGRTGMFAACLAREVLNMEAEEAIYWVRKFIPYAMENVYQEAYVAAYQPTRDAALPGTKRSSQQA